MPLPGPHVKGLGYVEFHGELPETEPLEEDSSLSSTSLVYSLIEPDPADIVSEATRMSMEKAASFFKSPEHDPSVGLKIDFDELRKKEEGRSFKDQRVHHLTEKSERELVKRFSDGAPVDKMTIPLLSALGQNEDVPLWKRKVKAMGMVKKLLQFMDLHPDPSSTVGSSSRSLHMNILKEQLDAEQEDEERRRENETEEERQKRIVQETKEKIKEDAVLNRHSEQERAVIRENLGRLPASSVDFFFPFGKSSLLSTPERDDEKFFEDPTDNIYLSKPLSNQSSRDDVNPTGE